MFLKGARIGLRLDPEKGDPGSIRARISAAQIGWIGGLMSLYTYTRNVAIPEGTIKNNLTRTYPEKCSHDLEKVCVGW